MSVQICLVCGSGFKARVGALTCSDKCRKAHSRELSKGLPVKAVSRPASASNNCDSDLSEPKPRASVTSAKPYDASSIRVLRADEIASRFEWVHIADLAKKYARPEEWIERGFRACEHAGVSPDYFVERYLEKAGVDFREDVDAAFRELYLRKFDPGACLSL